MKIIGHRGAYGYEPENTLRSIAKAIELGAEMIEIDVYALPSGEVVLMHDYHLDRTTNGFGRIDSLSFDKLRELDAGKGERIPTLQEVIELIAKRVPLIIEVKSRTSVASVAHIIQDYLNQGWRMEHFMVSSFNHHAVYHLKQLLPGVQTIALLYSIPIDYAAFGEQLGVDVVAPAVDITTPEFVADAHARGLKLYAWVWEPIDDDNIRELHAMGADALYADYIDIAQAIIAESHAERAG